MHNNICYPPFYLGISHFYKLLQDPRLRVTGYHGLVITEVQPSDGGDYSCQVLRELFGLSHWILLQVDYMGVVQEVTHKLQVKTTIIQKADNVNRIPQNAKRLCLEWLRTHIHSGAPVTKVAKEAVSWRPHKGDIVWEDQIDSNMWH